MCVVVNVTMFKLQYLHFGLNEISEEEHQKERKYCDEFDDDLTIRHNNKWYEGEFITEPWDCIYL